VKMICLTCEGEFERKEQAHSQKWCPTCSAAKELERKRRFRSSERGRAADANYNHVRRARRALVRNGGEVKKYLPPEVTTKIFLHRLAAERRP